MERFTIEQVNKQIGLLRETGRFRPPNNGDPFVVRVSQYALSVQDQYTDRIFYEARLAHCEHSTHYDTTMATG
jgi:hypothetical protein